MSDRGGIADAFPLLGSLVGLVCRVWGLGFGGWGLGLGVWGLGFRV